MGKRKGRRRRVRECDACGERVRVTVPRAGRQSCRDCMRLPVHMWVSACFMLELIRAAEREERRLSM